MYNSLTKKKKYFLIKGSNSICALLTSPKVAMDKWNNFPAVILITLFDRAIIRMRPRAVLWCRLYQSVIYAISPTRLH